MRFSSSIAIAVAIFAIAATRQSSQPATRATTRPAATQATTRPKIRSLEEVLTLIPKDRLPEKGKAFEPLHADLMNQWLRANATGLIVRCTIPFAVARIPKDNSGIALESDVWQMRFGGVRFFVGTIALFPSADAAALAKLKHKDAITITGVIDRIALTTGRTSGSINLNLKECKLGERR